MNQLSVVALGVSAMLLLSACGVKTSGVRTMADDTFTITATDSDETVAKGTAMGLAEHHCHELGKKLLVTQIYKSHRMRHFYDVRFQCLNAGDPKLSNPQYKTIYRSNPED